ncbi:probable peptidyl-tRNA hydrolase [Triplophysa dalaica]|uniref:probable peptidyl-tRNA hydrolase n=1 Tax=Triplophysa dalaica TaxID=1582913 RepID=UPI0024DF7E10|nr:probable peptidyl-tRNA hydrolase [Triplophysa dalaica]XP_056602477.1 probable peptidyl-tRNA hydrolase [Triplophysa dalaica]
MSITTVQSQIWPFLTQSFKHPMALIRWMVTKLINRVLVRTLPSREMAGAVGNKRRKMIVGLGNPGMNGSRHSVGMAVLTRIAEHLGTLDNWRSDRQVSGEVIVTEHQEVQLVLLRPKLLMNVNGVSVAKAASKFSIQPEHILLIHDELDKPLGKFGIKHGGSARGHNGVRSCVDCLHTDVMPRLRIGIGRPSGQTSVERHVLGRFSQEEQKVLDSVVKQSLDVLLMYITDTQSQMSPAEGCRVSRKRKERTHSPAQEDTTGQNQK